MFKRLKNLFKRKPKQFIVLGKRSFSMQDAVRVGKELDLPVIYTPDVNDVRVVGEETAEKEFPDGKAEFLGQGTEEEWLEQQREDDGTKPWYERLKNL